MTYVVETEGPNSDEIKFWNGPQGQNWVKQNHLTDHMYDPFGDRAIECAALRPGERIIDVGCGCGKTTNALADKVSPGGHVTALDVSIPMLEVARDRMSRKNDLVDFVCADAATYPFEPESYDVLFSQFGLMFFHNPEEAFCNFNRALRPGGRIVFICWRHPKFNPWLMIPFDAVRPFVPDMPKPSPDVTASPFTMAPKERLEKLISGAGFKNVRLEVFDCPTRMGQGSLDECLNFVADFSNPVATALRQIDPVEHAKVLAAVRSAVAPYHNGETLELPASAWIASAHRPYPSRTI